MTASVAFRGVARDRWRDLEQTAVEAYLRGLQDAGWRGASDQLRFGFAASSALRYGPGCVRLVLPALLDETAQPHVELVLGISFDKVLQLWAVVCLEQVRLADDRSGSSSRSMYEGARGEGCQVGRCDEFGGAVGRYWTLKRARGTLIGLCGLGAAMLDRFRNRLSAS